MNLLPAMALATLVSSDDACSARLDHLLAIYCEYDLPFPPPDAQLVWKKVPRGRYLELRRQTAEDKKSDEFHGYIVKEVKPEPASLANTQFVDLDFVIHCHARGWKSLSCAAFRKWLAKAEQRAERQLAWDVWIYWWGQFNEPGTSIPVIAKYLKRIQPLTGETDEHHVALLRSLELAAIPSKSTPGSNDALIDELIEYTGSYPLDFGPAYKTLARRGFDAIPALIAHLDDDRLTRRRSGPSRDTRLQFRRVKDIVYVLLCAFAGQQLTDSNDLAERTFAAGRWFADAQKLGEEEYVVANVGQRDFLPGCDVLFPLLVEKYPKRLPEAYRRFIEKRDRWLHVGELYAKAIVESALPLDEKRKALEFAATHSNPHHREVGLRHLLMIDPNCGRELLLAELAKLGTTPSATDVWLATLVGAGTDPKAWESLTRTAKRVDPGLRVGLLTSVFLSRDEPDPVSWRRQLDFMAPHLTDTDVWDEGNDYRGLQSYYFREPLSQCQVRNYAAMSLLITLQLWVKPKSDWTAERWASMREYARFALEHNARR